MDARQAPARTYAPGQRANPSPEPPDSFPKATNNPIPSIRLKRPSNFGVEYKAAIAPEPLPNSNTPMFASNSRRLIVSAALLFTAVSVAAAQHVFADVSGTWIVSAQSPQGASESTAVLEQKGTALTGTITVPEMGTAKLTGTVKGDTVQFSFSLDMQGTALPVNVGGVIKDKDNMSGTIFLQGDMGNFPFTAKRKP